MKELTDKQEIILQFITEIIKDKGISPTFREIGDEFQFTAKAAYDHLQAIEKKGYIKISKNQSRGIELLRHKIEDAIPVRVMSIPLLGRIAAGSPIFTEENREDYIPVPDRMSRKGNLFAIKVVGESMIGDGINNGDIAIIQQKKVANNGEIVAALIDGETTLKTYYNDNDIIRLEPSNSKFKTIKVNKTNDIQILGKLIGLYRYY